MITIKEIDENNAELKIDEKTRYTTILLGIEMLIEILLEHRKEFNIDTLLDDLKRIYIRDNGGEKKWKNVVGVKQR